MPYTFTDFLHFGESLLFTLQSVGEWLFTRVEVVYDPDYGFLVNVATSQTAGTTIAELILGAGLVGFLGFRLAKFYTDIVL